MTFFEFVPEFRYLSVYNSCILEISKTLDLAAAQTNQLKASTQQLFSQTKAILFTSNSC